MNDSDRQMQGPADGNNGQQPDNAGPDWQSGGLNNSRQGNGKNRFWTGVLAGALATVFVGLIVVGMSVGIYILGKKVMSRQLGTQTEGRAPTISDSSKDKEGVDFFRVTAKMDLIQQIIGEHFLYEEDTQNVEDFIYRGMLAGLDDPCSVYYTESGCKSLRDSTKGIYSDIGAMISQNRTTGLCTIVRVFGGSSALEAGMQPGGIIYKVEDILVAPESLDVFANNYIKDEEGTPVNITVYRADKDEYAELIMKWHKIEVPMMEHRMTEDSIEYITATEFDMIAVEQFKAVVDELKKDGMKGLIVDLRSNPGGILDGAVKMADYLLPDDISRYDKGDGKILIVYTADKNEKGDVFTVSDKHEVDLPLMILTNGDLASASEVFTGIMKDYNGATVVGITSYGKGIVQNLIPLGDSSAIKTTTAHYYTLSGSDLHGKGIEPNVEVGLDEKLKTQTVVKPEEDNQTQKAVQVLKGKIQ